MVHLEALGAVDGHHLDRRDGVDALLQCPAHDVVQMAFLDQSLRVGVVGYQAGEPGVHLVLRNGLCHLVQVVPGGAFPQLGVHPQAHFGQGVLGPGGLMTAAGSGGDVGV